MFEFLRNLFRRRVEEIPPPSVQPVWARPTTKSFRVFAEQQGAPWVVPDPGETFWAREYEITVLAYIRSTGLSPFLGDDDGTLRDRFLREHGA